MLANDWRHILLRAWSVRLWAAASVIIAASPLVDLAVTLSDGWNLTLQISLRLLAGLLGLAGIWARAYKQKGYDDE